MSALIMAWLLPSRSKQGQYHRITKGPEGIYCPCEGFAYRQQCWHKERVKEALRSDEGYGTVDDPKILSDYQGAITPYAQRKQHTRREILNDKYAKYRARQEAIGHGDNIATYMEWLEERAEE